MAPGPTMMPDTSRRRSLAGLALAAGLLPVLLALFACIPVPIGDPETSSIDPGLSGAWVARDRQNVRLWMLRPYDSRTWIVTALAASDAEGAGQASAPATARPAQSPDALLARMLDQSSNLADVDLYKAWLTVLGGQQFLCLEPLIAIDDKRQLEPPYWLVVRVDTPGPDVMALRVPADGSPWDDVESREEAEELLRRNADRDEFFDSALTFVRVSPSAYDEVRSVLKRFGLGVED